jgi:hypothetical protein
MERFARSLKIEGRPAGSRVVDHAGSLARGSEPEASSAPVK